MPVRIDELEANVEPDEPSAAVEAAASTMQKEPDLRQIRQQLRQIEQREARLRAD